MRDTTHLVQEDNGWIQTYSSRQFWPLDPKPEDVCIDDIAHHLAYTCRHGGRIREFYSTAQHCIDVADLTEAEAVAVCEGEPPCHARDREHWCDRTGAGGFMGHTCYPNPRRLALLALMHDSAEAYFADVARPVKGLIPMLREVEYRIHAAVCQHFGLTTEIPACVKRADLVMLATERRDLLGPPPAPWVSLERVEPRPDRILPLHPYAAEQAFLLRFRELARINR